MHTLSLVRQQSSVSKLITLCFAVAGFLGVKLSSALPTGYVACQVGRSTAAQAVTPEGGGSVGAQLVFLLATHTPTHTVAGSMAPVDVSTVSRRIILVAEEKQK